MDVRVLGCSGTYPSAHCPCSGYVVTGSESRLWLDAGTGTFSALQSAMDFSSVDAMVLSHVHGDHCLDLIPYFYALRFQHEIPRGLPVYCPPGTLKHLARLLVGDSVSVFCDVLDFREIHPGDRVEVGDLTLDFASMEHPVPTHAVAITSEDHRLVFSADTGPGGDLLDFATGADSFICEATYQNAKMGPPLHLSAEQAGDIAKRAGVGALYITHIWPMLDRSRSVEEAAVTWGSEPVALNAGMVLRTSGSRVDAV